MNTTQCQTSALLSILLTLVACGGDANTTSSASSGGGGAGGAPPTPVFDPAIFDCTAPAPPERISTVPITCATDPSCTTRLVSGHRSAGGQLGVIAPENSLSAIRAAIALGIDYIETDPRPTKDGVIVNVHDTTVDRTTDGIGEVANLTLAEIKALHLRAEKFPGDFSCDRVPTLEEVLTEARGKVHVLIDANKTDRVDLLVEAVQKTNTLEWAIFDTSDVAKIDAALVLEPALFTMIRVTNEAELMDELTHFAAHPPVIVEMDGTNVTLAATIHAQKNRAFTDVFTIDIGAGLENAPSFYAQAFDTGIDIAQTDRPDLVLKFLGRLPSGN